MPVPRDEVHARFRGFFLLTGAFFIVFGLVVHRDPNAWIVILVGLAMLVPAAIAIRRHSIQQRSDSN